MWGAAALVVLGLLGTGIAWARMQAVDMRMAGVLHDQKLGLVPIPEAFRGEALRGVWDGTDTMLCPPLAPGLGETYQRVLVGDKITVSVEMPDERIAARFIDSVFLQLGTRSAPSVHAYKTLDPGERGRHKGLSGPYWSAQTAIISEADGAQEQILIGAGAKRGPVNIDTLSEELRAVVAAVDKDRPLERLNRAHEFFSARFPGAIFWRFEVDGTRAGKKGSCDSFRSIVRAFCLNAESRSWIPLSVDL